MKQATFVSAAWRGNEKMTRLERFLEKMDTVIPWQRLIDLIERRCPRNDAGTHPQERMLRIYFLQNCVNLYNP